jgi:hypothetical protein
MRSGIRFAIVNTGRENGFPCLLLEPAMVRQVGFAEAAAQSKKKDSNRVGTFPRNWQLFSPLYRQKTATAAD